ncbi:MAG: ribonuclease HII [Magnetococcales bacterium]|nr:ribonuclease HII [Magnetococcales bacterium]NGZ04924.1 ribonuclease HII [Magnetococcales bacterium]
MAAGSRPGLTLEQACAASGFTTICGVDEAGRGPLCGPVVAAAVVFPTHGQLSRELDGIDDSKRLTPAERTRLADRIRHHALATGLGLAKAQEIDQLNIRRATLLAMTRAISALQHTSDASPLAPDYLLIDGRDQPEDLHCPAKTVIRGDQISLSIAAASILAKTHRDTLMAQLAIRYPGYGWERNAGYPTAEHLRSLQTLGITPEHRRSYGPVARLSTKGES